jgi:AraC-like DNA-binding protein
MRHPASSSRAVPRLRLLRRRTPGDVEVADAYVARALGAMKADPARRWTVASLSRVAGLSRAPFARRFKRATGTSPLRWLTAHRLGIARSRLLEGGATLAAIAGAIGYRSEFALSRAFKRHYGMAPAFVRRLSTATRAAGVAPVFRAAA